MVFFIKLIEVHLYSCYWTLSNIFLWNRPKPFHFAIVDEVDSVLIDEGRNPLLISGEVTSHIFSVGYLKIRINSSQICSIILLTEYPSLSVFQASKDAARYPVAAKMAELLVQGLVSPVFCFLVWLSDKFIVLEQFRRLL